MHVQPAGLGQPIQGCGCRFRVESPGGDFAFIGRQRRLRIDDQRFPVDLLLFCARARAGHWHYALEGLPNKVMAAEYRTALPDEEVPAAELDRTQQRLAAAKPDRKR